MYFPALEGRRTRLASGIRTEAEREAHTDGKKVGWAGLEPCHQERGLLGCCGRSELGSPSAEDEHSNHRQLLGLLNPMSLSLRKRQMKLFL